MTETERPRAVRTYDAGGPMLLRVGQGAQSGAWVERELFESWRDQFEAQRAIADAIAKVLKDLFALAVRATADAAIVGNNVGIRQQCAVIANAIGAPRDEKDQRIAELTQRVERAEERIRAWRDGVEPPALEDDDAIGPPDIAELIEAAPRFTGDREGGPKPVTLEAYEAVVSRSEIVAYGRALAWQDRRIVELEAERDDARRRADDAEQAIAKREDRTMTDTPTPVADAREALEKLVGWCSLARLLDKGIAESIDKDPAWTEARAALSALTPEVVRMADAALAQAHTPGRRRG